MKNRHLPNGLVAALFAAAAAASLQAQVAIPPSFAMPAGSVDTTKAGFRVRPYATDVANPNTLAWTEDQLNGLYGPNLADLSGADASGYYTVGTVVNWNIAAGASVDNLAPADDFPGLGGITQNMSEEILAYLSFPTNGVYKMGVNSDDGFIVTVSPLNPKDRLSGIILGGPIDGGRGAADTIFSFSISQPGIYAFRLLYEQGGGGASISWFTVLGDGTDVLVNDTGTGAIKSYSKANVAPPFVSKLAHGLTGFAFDVTDDLSALKAGSLAVKLNGTPVVVTTAKSGKITTATYVSPTGLSAGVTNKLEISFADDATPAHTNATTLSFVETVFATLPVEAALPASAIDKTQPGFLYRASQYDSGTIGVLASSVAHAEAQLAGFVPNPAGTPYTDIAVAGPQTNGGYVIPTVLNLSLDPSGTEQGAFTSANGYPDAVFPGLTASPGDNIAGEVVTYLDLKAGLYTFAVQSADGFRLATAANPYDQFSVTLAIYDFRRRTSETQFNVKVVQDGIYPVRLLFWRQTGFGGSSNGSLEFYTVGSDGSKVLVNDTTKTNAVKAYWKRTAGVGSYVKYAGPSAFVSPFANDVGFKNVTVVINDGTNKVDSSSVSLTIDGVKVTPAVTNANGKTTLVLPATSAQIARMVHSATLVYADTAAARHTNSWNFNSWRNTVLPAPLYYEDFESTAAGPNPTVPTGWTAVNHTDKLAGHEGLATDDLNSDFYLGWVVVDKSFNISKDFGVSLFAVQDLNGVVFNEDTNPLLQNHYLRAESDVRGGNQVQDVTTKSFDLTGKTGIVLAFDSSYEQNQDNSISIEYTVNGGTNWNPLFYSMQDGVDGGTPDVIRDPLGNVDVNKTFYTVRTEIANYTDPVTGQAIGDTYGSYVQAPITSALAPFVEGRVNDDASESKRFEVFRVTGADNQKNVKFKFHQDGTGSWYWCIDNVGVYSVPSLVISQSVTPSAITFSVQGGKLVLSWAAGGTLQSSTTVNGPYTDVAGVTGVTATLTMDGPAKFFRARF